MSLKSGTGIPQPHTVHISRYDDVHAFKMADKIARKEGHRQVFVEYVSEIADNSRDASFVFDEDFTKVALATIHSPEIKSLY